MSYYVQISLIRGHVNEKYYVQISLIRGDVIYRGHMLGPTDVKNYNNEIVKKDFYTLIGKTPDINKGIRKPDITTYEFNTQVEQDNFINYCKTDFARFCLALTKNSQNIAKGELKLIPWMDFTQKWTDEKLFDHFNVDTETQIYIKKFIPDYYNIKNMRNYNEK